MKDSSFILAIIIIATVVAFVFSSPPQSIPTSELPEGYNVSSREGNENIVLSTTLEGKSLSIKGNEVEVGFFSSSNPDVDIFIQDENGYWIIFLSDGEREIEKIKWWSNNLQPGDKVTLPTREDVTVTFVGFDSEDNPLFEVFE